MALVKTIKTKKSTWDVDINVTHVIGTGAFGIIYKADDKKGNTCAAKSIERRQVPQMSLDDLSRFLQLDHPNIIEIFDVHQEGGQFWLFMEFCSHGDLNKFYETTELAYREKLQIMVQVAQGIEYLHSKNIAHRDIKPANMLVACDRPIWLKLTDFDFSKFIDDALRTSVMHTNLGTLAFQAPEFFLGNIRYHKNVDTFAAGLTYLAMLQTKKGNKMLMPQIENPKDPMEMNSPIGFSLANRIRNKTEDLMVVKVTPSSETAEVRRLIQRMTAAKSADRPSATDVCQSLAKVSADSRMYEYIFHLPKPATSTYQKLVNQNSDKPPSPSDSRHKTDTPSFSAVSRQTKPPVPLPVSNFKADLPTPQMLREQNIQYGRQKRSLERDQNGVLKPYPLSKFKQDVFRLKDYETVDNKAIEAPDSLLQGPLNKLVEYLTRPCRNQMQKARALFRWLSVQNLAAVDRSKSAGDDTVYKWLQDNADNHHYNRCYQDMCRLAGITSIQIDGYVKGEGYEPGDSLDDHKSYWLAVLIDDCWRLVDVYWASLSVFGGGSGEWVLLDDSGQARKNPFSPKSVAPRAFVNKVVETYFLADPHEFIFSHYPTTGDEMQLLASPVSLKEFTEMAYLKPANFNLGIQLISHTRCVLEAFEGECELEFDLPQKEALKFSYRLWMSTKEGSSTIFRGITLARFVYMEQRKGALRCRIVFPARGRYKFELYGRRSRDENKKHLLVCAYVIKCDGVRDVIRALPENTRTEWGPGEDLTEAGLEPITHKEGIIEAEDGPIRMRYKVKKKVEILAELHDSKKTVEELAKFIVHQKIKDEIVITAKIPEPGDYALQIYTKEEGTEGSYTCVCSYLVTGDKAAIDSTPYPHLSNGRLGPLEGNKDLRVTPKSHTSALIEAPESGELEITMTTPVPCDMSTKFLFTTQGKEENKDAFVFQTQTEKEVTFQLRIPERGNYAFKIYGLPTGKGTSHPMIYSYVIQAQYPKEKCLPFPERYTEWKTGCKLLEPKDGVLPSNQSVPVAVKVPGAVKMAMIGQPDWTYLTKGANGIWRCDVTTGNGGDEIPLVALLTAGGTSYSHLLKYKVENVDILRTRIRDQQSRKQGAKRRTTMDLEEKAQRLDEFFQVQNDLAKAVEARDVQQLRRAISQVEEKRYIGRLKKQLGDAKKVLAKLSNAES